MDDTVTLIETAIFAITAATLAFFLVTPTEGRETPAVGLFPTSRHGWFTYYTRTLFYFCIIPTFLASGGGFHSFVAYARGISTVLLLFSSIIFWNYDRLLCALGLIGAGTSVFHFLLLSTLSYN